MVTYMRQLELFAAPNTTAAANEQCIAEAADLTPDWDRSEP